MPNFDPGAGIRTIGQAASSLGSNAVSAMGALGSVAGTVSRIYLQVETQLDKSSVPGHSL
jgi:hypothetical protein